MAIKHKRQERRTPVLPLGEAPRDREEQRPPRPRCLIPCRPSPPSRRQAARNPVAATRLATAPDTVPVYGGSSRPCGPACALLDAPRCLTASLVALPVHGVSTTRSTTPGPGSQHESAGQDADLAWLRDITCQAPKTRPSRVR